MKILSNKEYDSLIIEIEFLKEVRKNDDWCIDMLTDKINQLEEKNEKLKEFNTELNGEYKNSLEQIKEISNNYNELKEENEKLKEENENLNLESKRLIELCTYYSKRRF